jgi:hypothetical protein
MKKEHIILLVVAGIALTCLAYRAGKISSVKKSVIKPGDKGKEIYGLQEALSSITGLKFTNMGAYDTETLNAVRYYMEGTKNLIDPEKGYINKDFAADMYNISTKIKKD